MPYILSAMISLFLIATVTYCIHKIRNVIAKKRAAIAEPTKDQKTKQKNHEEHKKTPSLKNSASLRDSPFVDTKPEAAKIRDESQKNADIIIAITQAADKAGAIARKFDTPELVYLDDVNSFVKHINEADRLIYTHSNDYSPTFRAIWNLTIPSIIADIFQYRRKFEEYANGIASKKLSNLERLQEQSSIFNGQSNMFTAVGAPVFRCNLALQTIQRAQERAAANKKPILSDTESNEMPKPYNQDQNEQKLQRELKEIKALSSEVDSIQNSITGKAHIMAPNYFRFKTEEESQKFEDQILKAFVKVHKFKKQHPQHNIHVLNVRLEECWDSIGAKNMSSRLDAEKQKMQELELIQEQKLEQERNRAQQEPDRVTQAELNIAQELVQEIAQTFKLSIESQQTLIQDLAQVCLVAYESGVEETSKEFPQVPLTEIQTMVREAIKPNLRDALKEKMQELELIQEQKLEQERNRTQQGPDRVTQAELNIAQELVQEIAQTFELSIESQQTLIQDLAQECLVEYESLVEKTSKKFPQEPLTEIQIMVREEIKLNLRSGFLPFLEATRQSSSATVQQAAATVTTGSNAPEKRTGAGKNLFQL